MQKFCPPGPAPVSQLFILKICENYMKRYGANSIYALSSECEVIPLRLVFFEKLSSEYEVILLLYCTQGADPASWNHLGSIEQNLYFYLFPQYHFFSFHPPVAH